MIEQGLFKRHFVGKDGFHWWIGQICKDEPWMINFGGNAAEKVDRQGFGFRYQVRIMGYHDDDGALPDSQLPWAHLVYPVTAGSGNSGSAESPQLRRGDFVYGFFIDGEDAQQPVIMGIIGQNSIRDYKTIFSDVDLKPFTPVVNFNRNTATGRIKNEGGTVSTYVTRADREPPSTEETTTEETGSDGTEDTDGTAAEPVAEVNALDIPKTITTVEEARASLATNVTSASVPGLTKAVQDFRAANQGKENLEDEVVIFTANYVDYVNKNGNPPSTVEPVTPVTDQAGITAAQQAATSDLSDIFTFTGDDPSLAFHTDLNLNVGLNTDFTTNGELSWAVGFNAFEDLNVAGEQASQAGFVKHPIGKSERCQGKKSPGKIQKDLQNAIQKIQKAKAGLMNVADSIRNPINYKGQQMSIQSYVNIQIDFVTTMVTNWMATQIEWVMENVERNINEALINVWNMFNPAWRQDKKQIVDTAMDLLVCHFKKILKNLFKMVKGAIMQVVDRYINVPLCAAQNIVASIIGKLTGLINSIISAAMGPINAALGVVDIVGDAMDYVVKLLSWLQCEEEFTCDEEADAFSSWGGNEPPVNFDINSFIEKVKSFASGVSQSVDPDNFDFDLDFSDIMDDTCNVEALLCGPPEVNIWGGGGSGATGNVVVSAVGDILGIDITNAGSGYTKEPFFRLEDACGKGHGAGGRPILGPVSPITEDNIYIATISNSGQDPNDTTGYWEPHDITQGNTIVEDVIGGWNPEIIYHPGDVIQVISTTTTYIPDDNGEEIGVTGIVITDPGFGYIGVPDGDLGGDGRIWATAEQTTIKRSDGTWDIPYWPGSLIDVSVGDEITTPAGSLTQMVCYTGDTKVVYGGTTHTVGCNGVISAPTTRSTAARSATYPLSNSKYPVILYICGVFISNGGIGYKEGDKIIIEPSMGAQLEPVFSRTGVLTDVKIISGGEGFKEQPDIYIESETGFNAVIAPRFCIDRIGDDDMKQPDYQDSLVSVIDCVGSVPPVRV